MEEFNNRQTPKLRFRQQQLNQPKAIEGPPPENKLITRLPSGSKNTIALPKLESRGATQSLVMKDIDREMSSLELSSKVRDLEVLMIDFKANIERRIQKTIEDNPQKFIQSFKQLEQQEMQLWKQVNDKQIIVQDQVSQLRNLGEKNRDALSQMILDLQKKLGEQELKLGALINQSEGIELKLQVSKPQQIQGPIPDNLEVKLLREAFNNERTHRDAIVDDLQRQWQDVHQRLVKQESDFYNKLKQQRDEFIEQNEKTRITIKTLDNMKLAKINQDQDYIKTLIGSIENRIADEVERRLKSEFDQRNVLENKIQVFKEEIRNDEKQILLGEQKFMKQMHDSVQSLNQIIKNTKEQLEANLAASQTIVTENIKTISKTVEMIRETSLGKVALIEQGQKELNYRVGETRQMMHEHATLINNSLQKEFKKQQEQLENYDQSMQKAVEMQNKILNDERQLNEDWKKQFSQKNLAIFTEVSTNFKNIKSEQLKEKTESQESIKKLQLDLDNSNKKHQQFFQNLDQKITQGLNTYEFKLDQQRLEFQEIVKNVQIQYNTVIHEQINFSIETARKDAQKQVLELSTNINERITREIEMTDTQTNAKLDHLQLQLKNLIRDREEFVLQKLQTMIDEEKELRQRLQELIEKYADMMRKFKEDLDFEIQTLKNDFDYKLNDAVSKLERDYSEKMRDSDRLLRQEILNVELKMQKQLEDLSIEIQKQLEQQKQFVKLIEKNIKSFVKQEMDQTKHELKLLIKEVEDDLFKLRIWTLQQVEKMNQAMKEIHIQIQSEMYMDRMINLTMQENFQEHVYQVLQTEKRDRLQWQFSMENQLNQLDISLNNKLDTVQNNLSQQIESVQNSLNQQIETVQNQLQQQIDDVNADFKQSIEKLTKETQEKFDNLDQQFNEKIEKLHEQIKEDARILQEQINERFVLLDQQYNQKLNLLQQDLENQLNDLSQKISQDLKDLFEELSEKLKQLRDDTQQGFIQSVDVLVKNDQQLKQQIDQCYAYFSSKFYLSEQIRQANEELDKERHTGIIGKLQLLVKEMERLEDKKNQIKKDLYDFIQGVQNNFNSMTEAIKAHTVFLNELDTKFTMEQLIQQTINEESNYKLQVYLMSYQKNSEERIQEIEEKIETLDTTVHNQMAQIQEDQDQINTNLEKDIKKAEKEIENHEEQLRLQEEQLKTQDEQLKLNLQQSQQLFGNIQLMKTMNGAMEINLSEYVKDQLQQTLDLMANMNKTTLLNLQNMENNLKVVLEKQIVDNQKGSSEKINLIMEDQKKVISDLILLKDEVDSQFEKVKEKFDLLANDQGTGKQQANDLSQNMVNYGIAIEEVQKDLKREVDRLQQQIDNLGQNVAIAKQGQNDQRKVSVQQDNSQVLQVKEDLNQLTSELEKQFDEQDKKIVDLQLQVKKLQTKQPDKSPQNNNNNVNSSQIQQQIDEIGGEIDRLDKEINNIKKQIVQQPAGNNKGGNQTSNKDIQEIQTNMDDLEKRLNQEMQKVKKQVEAVELKSQGVTKDEFEDFQKQLEEEFTRLEQQIEQGGKGATPTQKSDQGEIKAMKDEIAAIKKQLASGGGAAGKGGNNAQLEGKVTLLEKEIGDINEQLKNIEQELEEIGKVINE